MKVPWVITLIWLWVSFNLSRSFKFEKASKCICLIRFCDKSNLFKFGISKNWCACNSLSWFLLKSLKTTNESTHTIFFKTSISTYSFWRTSNSTFGANVVRLFSDKFLKFKVCNYYFNNDKTLTIEPAHWKKSWAPIHLSE